MNSGKAAEVADAINGLPCVAYDPEESFAHLEPGDEFRPAGGLDRQLSGPHVRLDKYAWLPARVEQTGEIGFGDDPVMRPNYDVFVTPLVLPTRPLPSISIPPDMVHEVAKHGCRIRVCSGLRGEYEPGQLIIKDDLAHDANPDAGGDRCPECRSTRFTLRNGEPVCARCGWREHPPEGEAEPVGLEAFVDGGGA